MANLTETAGTYPAGIYQIEQTDQVLGGAGNVSNSQALSLANRTAYLKAFMDSLCGVPFPYFGSTAPSGFVLASGRTIGSASSGATERANADTQNLFTLLWNSLADAQAPVSSGRGANAAADWAANKTITLPDMRGRTVAGKDDMGGTAAGRLAVTLTGTKASTSSGVITGLSSTTGLCVGMQAVGTGVGTNAVINSIDSASQVTLSVNSSSTGSTSIRFSLVDGITLGATGGNHIQTLATPQIPSHNHAVFLNDPGHTHATTPATPDVLGSGSSNGYTSGSFGFFGLAITAATTGITVRDTTGGGGTANQTAVVGGGQAHSNTPPTIVTNYIIKL